MSRATMEAPAALSMPAPGKHGRLADALHDALAADPLKAWKTAQARATLAGFVATLAETDDGKPELICSRWSLTRGFADLAELEAWLVRVGAPIA